MQRALAIAIPFIRFYEGCRLKAYRDIVGIWTIGWGDTYMPSGQRVQEGDVITQDEANDLNVKTVQKVLNFVESKVQVALNDNQLAALTSFTYNVGEGNFERSSLLKKLNTGIGNAAFDDLLAWDCAGGVRNNALLSRRTRERTLALTPIHPAAA